MNKLVKLPLFLGICGAACAGVLAGVHAITAPIIEKTSQQKAAKSYVSMYESYGVTLDDVVVESSVDLSDELFNNGCTGRAIVEKAKGVAYTFTVNGYGGAFSFQVAFAKGKYLAYTDLGNNETAGYGKDLIGKMQSVISDKSSSEQVVTKDVYSGASFTGKPIAAALEACRADYNAWYNEHK